LELHVGDAPVDLIAEGFDAAIGPKEHADPNMIPVRLTGPMKMAIVGAPAYFARKRTPRNPIYLVRHSCVQLRLSAKGPAFAWPFKKDGKTRRVPVSGGVTVSDAYLAFRAPLGGLGIALTLEAVAEPFLRSGQLVRVLEEWSPSFDGLFIIPGTGRSLQPCAPSST
jgi:DNA-binding transcriptional LysR family regulator